MIIQEFHPGQRWISHTESELGLGLIEAIDGRKVRVLFPAAEETRVYAINNAPLNRVHCPVGERIRAQHGLTIMVSGHEQLNGCTVYLGHDPDGRPIKLVEQELDSTAQFNKPEDRLFAGQIDPPGRFALRVETLRHLRRQQQSPAYGLLGPRVQLLEHQMYIADQVARRHAPRVLLADEVGLGKTIEAGLILHQQLISGRISRVLVMVPETLLHQWLVEMLRRFNLRFSVMDEERFAALSQDQSSNPFDTAQLVLCTLQYMTSDSKYMQQAIDSQWDVLVVDEAHHLRWSETEVSESYRCVDQLAANIPGLLLLTATPEQLGRDGHFARLRLLDPDRFYDRDKFIAEQTHYQAISDLMVQVLEKGTVQAIREDENLRHELTALLGSGWDAASPQGSDRTGTAGDVDEIVQSLLDRHGTGRVLFRNTREAISGFPSRACYPYPLQTPPAYLESEHADLDSRLHPERFWGEAWLDRDPRVAWLADWLSQHKADKVLLICAYSDTAVQLEQWVRMKTGLRSAVFHEGLSLVARDRAAAYFADEDAGAQVLICSEIGSEGRNFQFAHHLVLFDLPLNPDLLEQRIGRLDRIGQSETIHIHVPYYEQGAQAKLVRWYQQGLNAFEQVCPMGQALFAQFDDELQRDLSIQEPTSEFDALIQRTVQSHQALKQQLHNGRDRLLEMNSCRPQQARAVVEAVQEAAHPLELSSYMESLFDNYGVEQQFHTADSIVIRPTDQMLMDRFPGLPEDGLTATYRRGLALQREDMTFLTWEHPMVQGAMDMVLSEGFGNATFCTLKLPPLQPGLLIVEAILDMHCPAPKSLQLHRYLPPSCERIVVCSNGMDLTDILKDEHINARAERVKKRVAQDVIQHARPTIQSLIDRARELAEPWREGWVSNALEAMTQDARAEQSRIRALARVNPMIRPEEIQKAIEDEKESREHLSGAELRLDAVRVMLTT